MTKKTRGLALLLCLVLVVSALAGPVMAAVRWSLLENISSGLTVKGYEVSINAVTISQTEADYCYAEAILQKKNSAGQWEEYLTWREESEPGTMSYDCASVYGRITVSPGTYRVISYHSATRGGETEYGNTVGVAKAVPQ